MKKKACKTCKIFVDGDVCPVCKRDAFSTNWQGRIHFVNAEKSFIAKQMNVTADGEYAIKVR
ncbi:MAG: DNA-directed RNA polymerase subunit E'' [Candidatus Woesearchaeota archaeon]|nr:DNA-directed RNA polymerase subunit E'' [Candidatus Woesearchaeota archaeon]